MHLRHLADAPVQERGALRSWILMDASDLGSRHLVVTWVEVAPGADLYNTQLQ